jgi:5-methyltetrahydropteroyltriglutamate--homocysteine methyltransferase
VLGLVSTKSPELETAEELQARIDEAARFFPREQLGLSTQCGFASIVAGNPIGEQDEERKLRLVADTAHAAWA